MLEKVTLLLNIVLLKNICEKLVAESVFKVTLLLNVVQPCKKLIKLVTFDVVEKFISLFKDEQTLNILLRFVHPNKSGSSVAFKTILAQPLNA